MKKLIKKSPVKIALTLLLLLLATLIILYIQTKPAKIAEEVHYHAGFKVFIEGKIHEFSDSKYMSIAPCSDNDHKSKRVKSKEELQQEKAHLHDNIGDVVHVHTEGAVWGDLFKNIGFSFPDSSISGYLNGKPIADILSYDIVPYESVIIAIGDTKAIDTNQYVTYDHIKEIEAKSENCGT